MGHIKDNTQSEKWEYVDNFGGFFSVSNLGRVKSNKRYIYQKDKNGNTYRRHFDGKILRQCCNVARGGYMYVGLQVQNKRKTCKVHRLVCQAFHPNPDNKSVVNHKDGDKSNNKANNLEWATHKENAQHALLKGLTTCKYNATLTIEDVKAIRAYFNDGMSLPEITKLFTVSKATICRVVNYKIWADK